MKGPIKALVVVLCCFWLAGRAQSGSSDVGKPGAGAMLPAFSLPQITGQTLAWSPMDGSLSTGEKSSKPSALVIHFFQPDCNACQTQAKALETFARSHTGVAVMGVAHRGDSAASKQYAQTTGVSYPLAVGTGKDWVQTWARGDSLYIVDTKGKVTYTQYGYRADDPQVWDQVVADIVAGRAPRITEAARKGLEIGDTLPAIELPELLTDKPIRLSSESGKLVFHGADGHELAYRASLGFFSRY